MNSALNKHLINIKYYLNLFKQHFLSYLLRDNVEAMIKTDSTNNLPIALNLII